MNPSSLPVLDMSLARRSFMITRWDSQRVALADHVLPRLFAGKERTTHCRLGRKGRQLPMPLHRTGLWSSVSKFQCHKAKKMAPSR